MRIFSSSYHKVTYEPKALKKSVNRICRNLKKLKKKLRFDAIAFQGSSGAAYAYPVSVLTGMHLIYVRKEAVNRHHGDYIEGTCDRIRRYIILDDFIATGDTIRRIIKKIDGYGKELHPDDKARCVGVALYNDKDGNTNTNIDIKYKDKWLPLPKFKV